MNDMNNIISESFLGEK